MKTSLISILLILVFVFGSSLLYAQQQVPSQITSKYHRQLPPDLRPSDLGGGSTSESYISAAGGYAETGTEGSMYYIDEWKPGRVMLRDNSVMDHIQLRYNIYARQMQYTDGKDTLAFANPEELQYVFFDDHLFIYTTYLDGTTISSDYFEVIAKGECKLLARKVVKFHQEFDESAKGGCKESYTKCCELYIKKGEEPARYVNCDKKSICSALSDKEEAVRAFIEENHLKMKSREDLTRVMEFYNNN